MAHAEPGELPALAEWPYPCHLPAAASVGA